tara:strand:+ start:1518 stop:2840 length:1323 start_codon:yes stop_codon:yes gene_type:complete
MIDKILKFCFFVTILLFVFLLGFLSNELKLKNVYSYLTYTIDVVENRFQFSLKKKFGDRDDRKTINNSEITSDNNFGLYDKPNKMFEDYLLIKHDHTPPVLLKSPDKLVWTWDLSSFRNSSKMLPLHLYPNGDLIIGNYEKEGIYRINKDGQILWKRKKINHHWIDVNHGKIFIPSRKFVNLPDDLDKNLFSKSFLKNCKTKNSIFDTILILNEINGEIIKEIDLMEQILLDKRINKIFNETYKSDTNICNDPLHLNDIQVVDNYDFKILNVSAPEISEDDLILSFRSINTIIFYDYKKSIVKYIVHNLFDKQHSPRIYNDGFLYVFDNNPNGKNSKIVKINLENNSIESFFQSDKFKSDFRGRIQFFKNQLFVQSSSQGEVFKIECKDKFFETCRQEYVYSSNFSFFYPSNLYDSSKTFKKDQIYLADFYDKNYISFLD